MIKRNLRTTWFNQNLKRGFIKESRRTLNRD